MRETSILTACYARCAWRLSPTHRLRTLGGVLEIVVGRRIRIFGRTDECLGGGFGEVPQSQLIPLILAESRPRQTLIDPFDRASDIEFQIIK